MCSSCTPRRRSYTGVYFSFLLILAHILYMYWSYLVKHLVTVCKKCYINKLHLLYCTSNVTRHRGYGDANKPPSAFALSTHTTATPCSHLQEPPPTQEQCGRGGWQVHTPGFESRDSADSQISRALLPYHSYTRIAARNGITGQ